METRELTRKHVSIKTGVPFDDFVQRLESQLGRHDPSAYLELMTDPSQIEKVEAVINSQVGSSGMILFTIYPLGLFLALKDHPAKARQYMVGNPFFAFKMVRHDIRVALNAPLRVLVYEDSEDKAVVEYDTPSSIFGWLQNPNIDSVAKSLDEKLEKLIKKSFG
jgi:uncharacterized protein (DUF302 family)